MTQFNTPGFPPPAPMSPYEAGLRGPAPWSAIAITAFVLSLLGFFGFTAILGIILGIAGIAVTSGGRRRGMGMAIAAIPISLITGTIGVLILLTVVVVWRGAEMSRALESALTASNYESAAASILGMASTDFQGDVSRGELENWLSQIRTRHGALTKIEPPTSAAPMSSGSDGRLGINIQGKFVNGPATIRVTLSDEAIWKPRLDDIEIDGSSPRESPDSP